LPRCGPPPLALPFDACFVVLLEPRAVAVLKHAPKHASGLACDAFRDLQSRTAPDLLPRWHHRSRLHGHRLRPRHRHRLPSPSSLLEPRAVAVLKHAPKHASGLACDAFRDLQSCSGSNVFLDLFTAMPSPVQLQICCLDGITAHACTATDRFVVLLEPRAVAVLKHAPKHASGLACDAFRDLQSSPRCLLPYSSRSAASMASPLTLARPPTSSPSPSVC
jgi:hypothetical protein